MLWGRFDRKKQLFIHLFVERQCTLTTNNANVPELATSAVVLHV